MHMKKFLFFCLSIFTITFSLCADIKLISPAEGEWANRQMLVIDNSGGGDYFYSVDGANPETFGFAYDGPVLLDVEGEVKLNVTRLAAGGKKETASVNFKVTPDNASKTSYHDFVQTFYESGLLNYSAGSEIVIPANLFYSLGEAPLVFIPGKTLKLSESCVLSRFIPCTISDKSRNINYRFVIRTYPQTAGIYSKRDIPFSIKDWETICFDNIDMIYRVDSEYWGLPKEPRKLDRSVSHMISWQPLEYDSANPVEFFVLPPKPEIIKNENDDGSIVYSIKGDDSYTLSILNSESGTESEQFSQIGVDAFYGDRVSGILEMGIFSNSVYQGKVNVSYSIDKKPPELPEIISDAEGFCSRDSVKVKINVQKGADLYIALSEPLTLSETGISYSEDNSIFKNVPLGQFRKVRGESYTLNWAQNGLKPVYYKVAAYSVRGENKSIPVEYGLVIDNSNYYFDSDADEELADGTVQHPFTQFSQFADALVKRRVVKLRVKGKLKINEAYPVEANFEIENAGDALLDFGPKGSLNVKASTIEITGCRIQNSAASSVKTIVPLLKLEKSVLTMKDCVIGTDFAKNGNVIEAYNSIINISDTIGAANAVSYVSFISAVKSRISIQNSSFNTNADTSVVISADGGSINAAKNEFMVSGASGRIAELFGVKAEFHQNIFKSRLTNTTSKVDPIYVNKSASLIDDKNERQGF